MTHDEIRITVAECCNRNYYDLNCHPDNPCYDDCCEGHSRMLAALPDYPASLDACAEFERTLDSKEHGKFRAALIRVVNGKDGIISLMSSDEYRAWFSATPLQRCEAFLRVKGKWKEAAP